VLCHDLTLDRYGYPGWIVEEMNWADLAALDMGSWFSPFLFKTEKMMTLKDLFELYGQEFIYHIELKGRARKLPEAVYRLIDKYDLSQHCIITSFSYEALAAMRSITPSLRLGWLVDKVDPAVLVKAKAIALFQLCPRADEVDIESVSRARDVVSEVRAWGLTGKSTEVVKLALKVKDAGCDGLTINWPDWLSRSP
jgi:glycerophosphoryl diester phosphodiesterase